MILIIVLIFPFWDLFLALGIRTINQAYFLDPVIIEYPEKNEKGQVESLSGSLVQGMMPSEYLKETEKRIFIVSVYPNIKQKVADFIEMETLLSRDENDKPIYGFAKIYINKKDMPYELITKSEARYSSTFESVSDEIDLIVFQMRYSKFSVIDTKKNKVIAYAPSLAVSGVWIMDLFRREILMMTSGPTNKRLFGVGSGRSFNGGANEMLENLFHIEGV